jgi:predicted lipid-binding transport protein (Tim44 family)
MRPKSPVRRTSFLVAGFAALALALTPGLADARAGGGSSFGSRGSRTWSAPPPTNTSPYAAQPMQRSMTPNTPSPSPGFGAPAGAGFGQRSPFASGLLGGLIGAGLGGLLFGHGLFGGVSGIGGFLGFLLQIFLIVMVVRWLFRRFFRGSQPTLGSQPALAGGPGMFARNGMGGLFGGLASNARGAAGGPPGARPGGGAPVTIAPADYQAFEQNLKEIQAAWSDSDLNRIRTLATPEMVSYFAEQLADYASRGQRNTVTEVRLLQGDLAEAWQEGGRQYATVAMRFSMIDVTRDATGRIVEGSPNEHVTATELWTFVRSAGGRWILSAIQQAR